MSASTASFDNLCNVVVLAVKMAAGGNLCRGEYLVSVYSPTSFVIRGVIAVQETTMITLCCVRTSGEFA